MARQIKKSEKPVEHPLETVLDLDRGSTMQEFIEPAMPTQVVKVDGVYDEKDMEIEEQLQEVYDVAMTQFEVQAGITESVEGKYAARNAEVAVQFLTTALQAAQTKATVKGNKDKLVVKALTTDPRKGEGGTVILDRNELMKALAKSK